VTEEIRPEGALAALGDAVPPPEVTHGGRAWKIGHPTQLAKAELEKLVVQVAEQNLADLKGVLSPASYAAKEKRLDGLVFARAWQTWGELWSETMNGPQSFPLFLLSLMRPHHPAATVADAEALWLGANRACRNALVMVLPGFFDLLASTLPAEAGDRQRAAAEARAEILSRLRLPTLTAAPSTTPSP
jgi:hypothetical protein